MELEKVLKLPNILTLKKILGVTADLHLVGGAVRDILLDRTPKDFDFATALTPDEMIHMLQINSIRWIPVGIRRGTLAIVIKGEVFEVTTFRDPSQETQFTSSIEEDLPARDFTINAIAISLNTGKLVDPFRGEEDLKNNVLKAVGNPERRFMEDPHRILRMLRFGIGQNRKVDQKTKVTAYKLATLVEGISIERIRDELSKILITDNASEAFKELLEMGILNMFIPELVSTVNIKQNKWHLWDVFTHILKVVDLCPKDKITRLAALLHDVGKPLCISEDENGRHFLEHETVSAKLAEVVLKRLKFPSREIAEVVTLIREHMRPIENCKGKAIRKTMVKVGDLFPKWLDHKKADKLGGIKGLDPEAFEVEWNAFLAKVTQEQERKQTSKFDSLEISGRDIMALGVAQGPNVGIILSKLQEIVIDDPDFNQRRVLIVLARRIINGQ